jgi:hypothetical protein
VAPALAQQRTGSDAAFSPATIRAEIAYLASDPLRGRASGEPGNEAAARFIARAFARDGLKPLGTDRQRDPNAPMDGSGYFQPFSFIAGRAVGKNTRLEATFGGKTQAYRLNQEFEPSGVSGGGRAAGLVVFVGYGIHAPKANHDDYANTDVKGKIALLLAGSPGNDPHSPLAEYGDIHRKALDARELGAAAILVVLPVNSDAQGRSPFDFAEASDAGLPVLRLRRRIAETWLKAAGRSLADVQKQADAEKNVTASLPVTVRIEADVKKVKKVTANIVGMLEGSDPVLKNEVVVIGAHMDHLGMGSPYSLAKSSAPAVHHGADDNASGTAGVMQLAAYFSGLSGDTSGTRPVSTPRRASIAAIRPKRSLLFICFSGEELGLFGSDYYVNHPLVPLERTVAMLNMDMVGRLRDNKLIISGSGTAREWPDLIDTLNKAANFTVSRSESGFGASDQQSFYVKNIPVLFFFTGLHPDYHTPTDTVDKINAPGEARVLRLVAAFAERIADAPDRPTFARMKQPDQSGPASGFHVYLGTVPDYAAQVQGVQLSGVREGSPAEKGGLKAGDIIIKFGDRTVENVQDYAYALADHKAGDTVPVVVKRGDQTLTLTVTLAARRQ